MATSTEEILLRMGFDSSAVSRGTNAMLASQRSAATLFKGIWMAAASAIGGYLGMGAIAEEMERVTQLKNAAASMGQSVEDVQRLAIAARQVGIEVTTAYNGMERLSVKVGEARQGGKEAQAAFEKWGIAIYGRNNAEIVAEISDKMADMPDPAERAAMAVDLMGRGGKDLIPLLERGSAAMKAMGEHGNILSESDIKNIELLHSTVDAIKNTFEVTLGKIISAIADAAKLLGKTGWNWKTGFYGTAEGDAQLQAASDEEVHQEVMAAKTQKVADANSTILDYKTQAAEQDERAKKNLDALVQKHAELNAKARELSEQRRKTLDEITRVGQGSITLEQLAGRTYTEHINQLYGKGGRFDLESGTGPGARIAQEAELAQKQQLWDIIHGNATFDARGNLIGGQAFEDRQRQMAAENKLGAYGLETPAMKQDKMNLHLADINRAISDLQQRAAAAGININVPD